MKKPGRPRILRVIIQVIYAVYMWWKISPEVSAHKFSNFPIYLYTFTSDIRWNMKIQFEKIATDLSPLNFLRRYTHLHWHIYRSASIYTHRTSCPTTTVQPLLLLLSLRRSCSSRSTRSIADMLFLCCTFEALESCLFISDWCPDSQVYTSLFSHTSKERDYMRWSRDIFITSTRYIYAGQKWLSALL